MSETRPTCPFCAADWTDQMLADLDAVSGASACACCGDDTASAEPLPVPTQDLCCASCGRAIFTMPKVAHVHGHAH